MLLIDNSPYYQKLAFPHLTIFLLTRIYWFSSISFLPNQNYFPVSNPGKRKERKQNQIILNFLFFFSLKPFSESLFFLTAAAFIASKERKPWRIMAVNRWRCHLTWPSSLCHLPVNIWARPWGLKVCSGQITLWNILCRFLCCSLALSLSSQQPFKGSWGLSNNLDLSQTCW